MSFGQIVKGTLLPKVPLKTLFEEDTSADAVNDSLYKAPKNLPDSSQKIGASTPYIKIGGQIVTDIDLMVIDETSFIPTITLTFVDGMGEFAGNSFPKTNLIMNVYIKSGTEKLKPVRCDFLITSVKSMPGMYTGGRKGVGIGITYTVKGELYVPGIYTNVSKSYANLNSKDALKRICGDIGLGFAENENSPNDRMTWINTNMSALYFIKTILQHSYQDDDSFFMGFIDKYYYLNYIEVNKQLKVEDLQRTFVTYADTRRSGLNQRAKDDASQKALEEETMVNYLTTEMAYSNLPNYVPEMNLISKQGDIIKHQGYKKKIFYYDHLASSRPPKEKFKDFFMSPLKSLDRSQNQFLVPDETSLAENTIKKWMNIDYGNAHPEWNASRLLNSHNLKELDKIQLRAVVDQINLQVIRGFTIPVYVSIQQAEKILKESEPIEKQPVKKEGDSEQLNKEAPDLQLTGYYYVSGAKYYYDSQRPVRFYTEFFLSRREWAPSKKLD